MFKKRQVFFSNKTSSFFLEPFTLKTHKNKRSSHDVFSLKTSLPNTRANNLFSKKQNNQGVARFQKQIVLGSHRNNFCFQNARSRFQALFSTHIPSPKWTKKMREWSFKTIICLTRWQSTLGGNDQYKGATLCLEEKILENEMVIYFNQTRGHFGLQKTFWSFQQVTLNVSGSETRSNDGHHKGWVV